MNKLLFGTAGIPVCQEKRDSVLGVQKVRELGLDCMELEFVHGVNMGGEQAAKVRDAAKQNNIVLTAHGPYYINLNSLEPQKIGASRARIIKTAKVADQAGAFSITFHVLQSRSQIHLVR